MVTFKDFYLSVLGLRAKPKLKQCKKKKKTQQIPRIMTKHCATSEVNMLFFLNHKHHLDFTNLLAANLLRFKYGKKKKKLVLNDLALYGIIK